MSSREAQRSDVNPLDELSPELRRAVERIVQEAPPEALMERALEAARRQQATEPDVQPRSIERRQLRRALPWGLVAAAAIGAVLLFRPASLFHSSMPGSVVVPQVQTLIAENPPTVWTYRKALGQSPEMLEALLDFHTQRAVHPEPQSLHAYAFPYRSQPTL
jgi:hypothetical protein